ncbi:MAG: MBL fold metallo-hydrolase [Abitibacteriaceae bacterium]|nr:MBL fold metallo-hydrolase [Abditibacteriaceae bacterium]
MKLTFLGTGTSYGVPYIGCDCPVCRSKDPRNKRLRCSILVEAGPLEGENHPTPRTRLLVDTTPDLRQQLLRANVANLTAVLWTHAHNDHIIGLDDIRPLCDRTGYIDGYGSADTLAHLKKVFEYIFEQGRDHGGFPRMTEHPIAPRQTLPLGDIHAKPIPILHGRREIFAYKFMSGGRTLVYATDCSAIPDASWSLMQNADVLVLDALRRKEHPTHFSVDQAVHAVSRLRPGRAFFTHIAHDLDHVATNAGLPEGVELAYDGLSIEV